MGGEVSVGTRPEPRSGCRTVSLPDQPGRELTALGFTCCTLG